MRVVHYLAYGSNLLPARLRARVGEIALMGSVRLENFSLSFTKRGRDGSGKCTLLPHAGETAHGAVYALSWSSRKTLDRIEGVGSGYDIHWLETADYGRCCLYLATSSHLDRRLQPFDWYKALVIAGAEFHAFPHAYRRRIASVSAIVDADRARAATHAALLGADR